MHGEGFPVWPRRAWSGQVGSGEATRSQLGRVRTQRHLQHAKSGLQLCQDMCLCSFGGLF